MSTYPNFVASNTNPCHIEVTDETKARRAIGGTFFRSIITGTQANSIFIQGSVVKDSLLVEHYVLAVTQRDISTGQTIKSESFSVLYSNSPPPPLILPPTPPPFPTPAPTPSPSIILLRAKVNSGSKLIQMPPPSSDYLFSGRFDSNVLSGFPIISLVGGNGAPVPPEPAFFAIRTGPTVPLYYILRRDIGSALIDVNQMEQWNGDSWQPYSPN
jgi:hypothetical protein